MKTYYSMLAFFILSILFSCTKQSPDNPVVEIPAKIDFLSHNLYPEGLAYDASKSRFIVSSATMGMVGSVSYNGDYTGFLNDQALTGTAGIKVDVARKRIWVCNVEGGVGCYDLNGTRIFYADLSTLAPGTPLFINDEAIDKDGNVYVTNSAAPIIYKIDLQGKATLFFQNNALATGPDEYGFNGIQYASAGYLVVAHTAKNQLIKIPINGNNNFSVINLNAPLMMPDGLLLSKDGKQIVVVSLDHIFSFITSNDWTSGALSTSMNVGATSPTSLTSDGKKVYVLYAFIDKLFTGEDNDIFSIKEVPLLKPDIF